MAAIVFLFFAIAPMLAGYFVVSRVIDEETAPRRKFWVAWMFSTIVASALAFFALRAVAPDYVGWAWAWVVAFYVMCALYFSGRSRDDG